MAGRKQFTIERQQIYRGHKGSVFGLEISADEQWMYTSGDDGVVAAWDLRLAREEGKGLLKVPHAIYTLVTDQAGRFLMAGSTDGTVYQLDLKTGKLLQQYRKWNHAVYGLKVDESRNRLLILYAEGQLGVLQLDNFQEIGFQRIDEGHLRTCLIGPDSRQYIFGTSNRHIVVMDAASGEIQRKWLAHDPSVFCLAMHQDGRYLLSGGRDAQIKVWDIKQDFRESKRIAAHMYTVNDLAIFQGGDFFASASRDKTIKLWDAYAFDLQKVIDHERNESHTHSVNRIKCLITDNSLISCSDDRMLMRWKVEVQE